MAARLIREDQVSRKDRLKRAGALFEFLCQLTFVLSRFADCRADEARQTLAQEFATLGSSVDMELRQRITTIHDNDAALDKQSKALRNRVNTLTKTTRQFGGIADSARIKLKVCVVLSTSRFLTLIVCGERLMECAGV